MRRFRVWLGKNVVGDEGSEEIVEFPDSATQAEIDEECGSCLETMIQNELDTGWAEILEEKHLLKPVKQRHRECGGTFSCAGCKRVVCWCDGAADDMPEHCSRCANAAHADKGEAK